MHLISLYLFIVKVKYKVYRIWRVLKPLHFCDLFADQLYVFLLYVLNTVTDIELKRLKDAFKRTCGLSYYMTQQCFIREVLGDGVPPKVAEVTQELAVFLGRHTQLITYICRCAHPNMPAQIYELV